MFGKKSLNFHASWQSRIFPLFDQWLIKRFRSYEERQRWIEGQMKEAFANHETPYVIFLQQLMLYLEMKQKYAPKVKNSSFDILSFPDVHWVWLGQTAYMFLYDMRPVFDEYGILADLERDGVRDVVRYDFTPFGVFEQKVLHLN